MECFLRLKKYITQKHKYRLEKIRKKWYVVANKSQFGLYPFSSMLLIEINRRFKAVFNSLSKLYCTVLTNFVNHKRFRTCNYSHNTFSYLFSRTALKIGTRYRPYFRHVLIYARSFKHTSVENTSYTYQNAWSVSKITNLLRFKNSISYQKKHENA